MEMLSSTVTKRSILPVSMPPRAMSETAAQPPCWYRACSKMLHHVRVEILLAAYASLIGLLQLKYHDESAFETRRFFMTLSVVAMTVFALAYWILEYHTCENSNTNESYVLDKILVSIAFFSMVTGLLSINLVLLLPAKFVWIAQAAMGLIVIAIIACVSIEHVNSLPKKMHVPISKVLELDQEQVSTEVRQDINGPLLV
ncbi:unnamed protein product [Lactuca saligna]|uniref:Uncharacterized protein n=1 Tax=Lactuca saligna TaxID=75948 RepID=A0AA35VKR5_LACSI|nr:unnamed protein product [Lactuca saligna]